MDERVLSQAIDHGVVRGLERCRIHDDDIRWMAGTILAAVLEEIREAQKNETKRNAAF